MSLSKFFAKQPPVFKAALTSGSIMMMGDIIAQQIVHAPSESRRLDWRRTLRFGVVGCTLHGPYFFKGMRAVDNHFGPAKTITNAAKKTITSQAILFPPFVALLFGWVGVLEGKKPCECVQKIKDNYPSAFKFGMFFWPTANIINFRFIEPNMRVLYVSMAGLLWNTFISWVNARSQKQSLALKHGSQQKSFE